jgi:hypothetical protein
MTYTKPEIVILGSANQLVELAGKGSNSKDNESPFTQTAPAYDLDE